MLQVAQDCDGLGSHSACLLYSVTCTAGLCEYSIAKTRNLFLTEDTDVEISYTDNPR